MNATPQHQITAAIQQANQLIQRGALADASQLLSQILKVAPQNAEAAFQFAFIALQQNQFELAIERLKNVQRLVPNHPNVMTNLAHAYSKTNQAQKANKIYEKLIKQNVQDHQVYYQLALNLRSLDQIEKAKQILNKAIKLFPEEETLYSFLAVELYQQNEFEASKEVYEKAYKQGFRSENLLSNLAKVYGILGLKEKTIASYNEAIEAFPSNYELQYQLSRWDNTFLTKEYLETLKTQLDNNLVSDSQIHYAYYLKAKGEKQSNQPSQEMSSLVKGHELYRRSASFRYETDFYLKHLAEIAKERNLSTLKEDNYLASMTPVFLVGTPRSGSTLAESILTAGTTDYKRTEESGVMLHSVNFEAFDGSKKFWSKYSENIKHSLKDFKVNKPGSRFTDKSLDNFFIIDVLLQVFPKSKIVWCKRTPLASLVSILQNNMVFLPWAHTVEEIIEYLETCNEMMDDWLERYPQQIYIHQYEEFTDAPEKYAKSLYEYCEQEWDPSCLEFYSKKRASRTASNAQIRSAINKQSAKAYEQYIPFFEKYIDQHPWLIES